jgi:beta-glucosidase
MKRNKIKRTVFHRLAITLFFVSHAVISWGQENNMQQRDIFITNLMQKMTFEEKLGQMNLVTPTSKTGPFATKNALEKLKDGSAGNIYSVMGPPEFVHSYVVLTDSTRLKTPLLCGLDIIHGFKTVFPIPLGLSCSWDTLLIEKTARVAAIEGSAVGYNWTFSPMVDISRDPRWGRVMEGSGEDPYLGGIIARAMIKGYQGSNFDETSLMACVKHFAIYGASEAGRDYNVTDMSKLTMYQTYLPPFKAAVEAGVGSIMSAFNEIDGIPATANKWLLTDLLRKEWGFNGFVVTDFNAIQELIAHGVAEDYKHAAELALNSGVDMDMASESMVASLKQLLQEGKISMKQIDDACRRVLEAKYKLGLFSNPYRNFDSTKADKVTLTAENIQIAKEAALKSIVLLKNDNNVLPLKKDCNIALIGPFANEQREMFSMWSFRGEPDRVITMLDGIKKHNPNVKYAEGTQVTDEPFFLKKSRKIYDKEEQEKLIAEALEIANKSDVVVLVLGEALNMSGEAKSKTNLDLPNCQKELLKMLKTTGKPVVLVLVNGRPLTIEEDLQYADAVLETWRPGTAAGSALADILFGNYNPSGKLTMTFPRTVGQIPIYYNHKNTGRPFNPEQHKGLMTFSSYYIDQQNTPLFPFGYGLSYTSFEYGDIVLNETILSGDKKILNAKIKISNTGKLAGEETVQLYIWDLVASVTRPVRELKKFQKVFLHPGETKEVSFNITVEDLKFYNNELKWDWESGKFNLYIGTNCQEIKEASFVWSK